MVVLRKVLASVIAENNRLRRAVDEHRDAAAKSDARNADMAVENAALRAENERQGAEIAEKDRMIAAMKKALDEACIKILDLERREAYHDNPNAPPSNRSLTLMAMRREDTEARRSASTGRGPGRERGHPGTTAKLDDECERVDRYAEMPEKCPKCGGTDLHMRRAIPRDVVDINVTKSERRYVLHDVECRGCGYVVEAPRHGINKRTILSPRAVAIVGSLKDRCRATAGQARGVLGDMAGVWISRASAAAAINAAADGIRGRADAIREREEMMASPGEADEACDCTAVWKKPEDDGSPPGTGKNCRRREYKPAWAWIVVTADAVRVLVATSRGAAVFQSGFPDRRRGSTVKDAYVVYLWWEVGQEDWIHKIRAGRHAAKRAAAGDPSRQAVLEALADRMAALYERAKGCVPPGGALQDPRIDEKAAQIESEMAAIADAYEEAGEKKLATFVRNGLGHYAVFLLYPGMSGNSSHAERIVKWLKTWLKNSEKTVSEDGRRHGHRAGAPVLRHALRGPRRGAPDEYAHIRAEGSRRPRLMATASGTRIRRGGGGGCSGVGGRIPPAPLPRRRRRRSRRSRRSVRVRKGGGSGKGRRSGGKEGGRGKGGKEGGRGKSGRSGGRAGGKEGDEKTHKAEGDKRAEQRRRRSAPKRPKAAQRRFAIAAVPEAAAAAEKVSRGAPAAPARPSVAASVAPATAAAAPTGPGPPSAGGPRFPIAAA